MVFCLSMRFRNCLEISRPERKLSLIAVGEISLDKYLSLVCPGWEGCENGPGLEKLGESFPPPPSPCFTTRVARHLGRYHLNTEAGETRSVIFCISALDVLLLVDGKLATFLESTDPLWLSSPEESLSKSVPKDECHLYASHHNAAKVTRMRTFALFWRQSKGKESIIFG